MEREKKPLETRAFLLWLPEIEALEKYSRICARTQQNRPF